MPVFLTETLGRVVRCAAPDPVAIRLAELLVDASPTEVPHHVDVRVDGHPEGWIVAGPDRTRTVGSEHEAATLAEWYVAEARLRAVRDRLHLHASACAPPAGAVVAVGPSGHGKSALAVAWSVQGLPLLSDDALVWTADARLAGIPRTVKLATPVARRVGVDIENTIGWSAGSPEVWFDPGTRGGWSGPVPPARIALVQWVAGAPTTMRAVPRAEAVQGIVRTRLASGVGGAEAFAQAAELVRKIETVEVRFGDAADAARVLARA